MSKKRKRKLQRHIAVIDAETDPFARGTYPQPFIFGYYNGKEYYQFCTVESLIEFLKPRKEIVYAHNGGKFDYFFILDYLEPYSEILLINGRLSKFVIGECEFRDSYNIIPVPMSDYIKEEIDYRLMREGVRDIPENKEKIEKYLKSDCVNQYNLVSEFIERYGLNLTLASSAMKEWQRISGLKPPRTDANYYAKFYPYYYGGRVECFEVGNIEKNFEMVDINSAYAKAMLSYHPFSATYDYFDVVEEWGDFTTMLEHLGEEIASASFFTVYGVSHGAFPYRNHENKLIFPNDNNKRLYTITGWELIAALETNSLHAYEILEAYVFHGLIEFSDYIIPFSDAKKKAKEEGDKLTEIFSKTMGNALYGKWAANPEKYGNHVIAPHEYVQLIESLENFDIADFSQEEREILATFAGYEPSGELGQWSVMRRDLEDDEKRYYNIATAASITGHVRAFLWRSICKCKGVLYCDTDSITAEDISGLTLSDELGEWKHEGSFDKGVIAGKKLYAFRFAPGSKLKKDKKGKVIRWKIASKGVKLSARQIIHLGRGHEVLFVPENPTYSVHKEPHFVPRRIKITA